MKLFKCKEIAHSKSNFALTVFFSFFFFFFGEVRKKRKDSRKRSKITRVCNERNNSGTQRLVSKAFYHGFSYFRSKFRVVSAVGRISPSYKVFKIKVCIKNLIQLTVAVLIFLYILALYMASVIEDFYKFQ